MQYRTQQDDMVDAICWKHYGTQAGVVEKVLEANPDLADMGYMLPAGVVIELPDIYLPQQQTQIIRLWT